MMRFKTFALFDREISIRSWLIFCLLSQLAVIASALGFEHIGGYMPCPLCLTQRVPYYVGILLTLLAIGLLPWKPPATALLCLLAMLLYGWGAILGGYHAGAEWSFWPGPASCASGGTGDISDAANMITLLKKTRIASCTDVQFRFLGVSLAGMNALAAAAIAFALSLPVYRQWRRNWFISSAK